ncbi:MAG: hypothetical protein WBM90_13330 [Acidimicrobiia bacterium]
MDNSAIDWLLQGDPAVRWQVERDLAGAPRSTYETTRQRIAADGWGERFLALQDDSGTWGGGLYAPKWTSTTYTLLLLTRFGLEQSEPRAVRGSRKLLDDAFWVDGGVSYWKTHDRAERCVNGIVLAITAWFDVEDDRVDDLAELLIRVPLADGGWNCQDYLGDTHSSMHTTISVLEGLEIWRRRRRSLAADDVIAAGQEFLLEHRLFRSHTNGEVISDRWTRFSFPPRWHYDVLRGLDYLRDSGAHRDQRAKEAIELVGRQETNGKWAVGPRHPNKEFFKLEKGGQPGRWNTLRAQRVLNWWDGGSMTS